MLPPEPLDGLSVPPERLYTRADLATWEYPGPSLAVLGDPVSHSLSPPMHNAALAQMAEKEPRLAPWRYYRFQIAPDELAAALPEFHARNFVGLNLTIPHKVMAVELVEAVAPAVQGMGAVNTLIRTPTGYRGDNTDGDGLAKAVEATLGTTLQAQPVVLLGAGGAARAAALQCLRAGCPKLWLLNRSRPRLSALVEKLHAQGFGPQRVRTALFDCLPSDLPEAPLVLNFTAVGLHADDALPLDLAELGTQGKLYDSTYGTANAWARRAEELGWAYADGLSMLVWQGVRSLELWSEASVPVATMEAAVRAALTLRQAKG